MLRQDEDDGNYKARGRRLLFTHPSTKHTHTGIHAYYILIIMRTQRQEHIIWHYILST